MGEEWGAGESEDATRCGSRTASLHLCRIHPIALHCTKLQCGMGKGTYTLSPSQPPHLM
jgi:hypothetical protein